VVEAANIVEAVQVVGVRVGEKHGVKSGDAGIEDLQAELGRRIHDEGTAVGFDGDARTPSLVARVGAPADAAVARDYRYAL
jgi:hypothetical protein